MTLWKVPVVYCLDHMPLFHLFGLCGLKSRYNILHMTWKNEWVEEEKGLMALHVQMDEEVTPSQVA